MRVSTNFDGGAWPLRFTAPIHPVLVHFTVGLTVAAWFFDLIASLSRSQVLLNAGCWNLIAACVATFGTVATGILSRMRLPIEEGVARSLMRVHMALGPIVLGSLVVMTLWRCDFWQLGESVSAPYLIALSVLILLVVAQAYVGGELVYRYAAEVRGRYRTLAQRSLQGRGERGPGEHASGEHPAGR